jgi:TM2 domain-containing membrane protein YozV
MYCPYCGAQTPASGKKCKGCGKPLQSATIPTINRPSFSPPPTPYTPPPGYQPADNSRVQHEYQPPDNAPGQMVSNVPGQKSKLAAGLLAIFVGIFGIHNFYLGFKGKAVAQLLITVLSMGFLSWVSFIWGLIEGILILTGKIDKDAHGNPLTN